MKIDGPDPIGKGTPEKPGSSEPIKGPSFGEVLRNVAKHGDSQAQGVGASAPLPEVFLSRFQETPGISTSQIVNRLDDTLTDLQMLGTVLGVTDVPLERLDSFVDDLSKNKDEIALMIGKIPDDELKSLASETLALVIEQINSYHAGYAQ